jgi:hypothetical protein
VTAVFFTPGLQFRGAKVLGQLAAEYSDRFDGDPIVLPQFAGAPRELPRLILKSADGAHQLTVSETQLSVTRQADSLNEADLVAHLAGARDVGLNYLAMNAARAGRVACTLQRVADEPHPAQVLSRHFCQERWINGPLNRPSHFEIHAHKQFRLGELFDINSWVRIKTANRPPASDFPTPSAAPDMILVEQDFNSLAEQMDTRELRPEEIQRFFELVPPEMGQVLAMYFPTQQP